MHLSVYAAAHLLVGEEYPVDAARVSKLFDGIPPVPSQMARTFAIADWTWWRARGTE
jgi:hypothetical protein